MIQYLLAVFAAYFVALTVATLDGPFGLCAKVRERVDPQQATWVGRGVNCPICVGFYAAFLSACVLRVADWRNFVLAWFGIAGAVAVIHKWSAQWS